MESSGILLDVEYCKRMSELAANSMADFQEMIADFNPNSHKSQYHYLVEILGIPDYQVLKKRKKKLEDGSTETEEYWATTFDANSYNEHWGPYLERLNNPVAAYVLGFRGWKKADSAFYRSYLKHVSADGRLRPSYKHHKSSEGDDAGGTVTGRLSCAEPNLQQIPKTDAKKMEKKPWNAGVKRSFIPTPGYELWEVDYSQLELRLGTAYAGVEELMEVFNDDSRDIFNEIAKQIGLERDPTKTYVYSTQYGAGINRLVSALGVTPSEAAKIRDDYYKAYPGFREIQDQVKSMCMTYKKVQLWSGRFRHFVAPRKEAHKAFNSVIQGGAADIVERKMVEVFHKVDQKSDNEVRMLLQVHDSIIFEIKSGTTDKWLPKIIEIMSDVNSLRPEGFGVHFAVDAHPLHDNYKGENNG
jgi:DNA polymerase I-like protein with 3'-5' exonuclease and polymerase domains